MIYTNIQIHESAEQNLEGEKKKQMPKTKMFIILTAEALKELAPLLDGNECNKGWKLLLQADQEAEYLR